MRIFRPIVVATALTLVGATAAVPASAQGAAYAAWSVTGGAGSFTGSMAVGITGFPPSSFTSDATTGSGVTIESGASTFLSATTPFGAVFGSSENQPYASIRYASGATPSTTTFTFSSPTPSSDWGFALGDIDADSVQVQATDSVGASVPVSALGFQGTFNYASSGGDVPTWDPATGTLTGNVTDTTGASGWFRPTVALSSITFTFTVQSGFPIYQVWFAALASSTTTTGATTTSPSTSTTSSSGPGPTTTTAPPTAQRGFALSLAG